MSENYILVTGSLAFDLIMDFPGNFADNIDPTKLHILNLSFLVDRLKKERGGTAGNIAYGLALLRTKVAVLGAVGEDFADYAKFLELAGVNIKSIKTIKDESTAQAFIITDKKDNQLSAFYPGAMNKNTLLRITSLKSRPTMVVISPNHPKAMINITKQCRKLKIPYLYDPGMQLPSLKDDELKQGITGAKILIGNDYEIGLIKSRLKLDSQDLLKQVDILITTLGEKGSLIETENSSIKIAPGKPRVVDDPTGAGDAYRAGFIAGLTRGFDLKTCGQMGSIASCFAVEKYGTTNHTFTTAQFCKRYQQTFKSTLKL
ncbi:MAG: carbohydrate kinase family protein [Candidatus Daviesbacteria bacterium]|nr:carbohydrate kinase family protein [Candidatus Daviesbacteria bacterium]